jgi:hypothetical protein
VSDTRRHLVSPRSRPAAWNGSARRQDRRSREIWGREQARDNDAETGYSTLTRKWNGLESGDGSLSRVVDQPFGELLPAADAAPAVLSWVNLQ